MAAGDFLTLAAPAMLETEVRKSRFIAHAAPVATVDEALAHVAAHSVADATHNCWAYLVGREYRYNDDGEPGGTAGRPILQAIEGQGLDGVAVLVVRWFGGVKLGAGGLVRAYGGCAAQCLRGADKRQVVARRVVRFQCGYAELGAIKLRLAQAGAVLTDTHYGAGHIELMVAVPLEALKPLEHVVGDITRGRSAWREDTQASAQ